MDTHVVDHVLLEVQAFQEGFELLSGCKTLEEMAHQFCHITRGATGVSFVNVYFRHALETEFRPLYLQKSSVIPPFTDPLLLSEPLTMREMESSEAKVFASLLLKDQSRLLVTFGPKLDRVDLAEFDRVSLQLFIQLWDYAYQSYVSRSSERQMVFTLNHRMAQLNRLIDTGIELSKMKKDHGLLNIALERMVVMANASRGIIHVTKGESNYCLSVPYNFDESPSMKMLSEMTAMASSFTFKGEYYAFSMFEKEVRKNSGKFDESDQMLLDALARQVQAALENDFLNQEAIEKNRMEGEITLAAVIQKAILPKSIPPVPGYDIFGLNIPSKEVSGDYFDCFSLSDGRLALVIADVAGKGLPAALLVSTLHASLRAYLESTLDLPELTARLNRMICRSSTDEKFITFFIALLSLDTGDLHYLNAGHNPILAAQAGRMEKLLSGGIALGIFDQPFQWKSGSMRLAPGDRLLLYTDGVPEAMNEHEDFFTEEALEDFFVSHSQFPALEFVQQLITNVRTFSASAPQVDDVTLLYLKRIPVSV